MWFASHFLNHKGVHLTQKQSIHLDNEMGFTPSQGSKLGTAFRTCCAYLAPLRLT